MWLQPRASGPRRHNDGEAARARQRGDDDDRCRERRGVGTETGDERAGDEAEVAPEPVDPDRLRALARPNGVRDGGEQGRIDHRGADTEQQGGGQGGRERAVTGDKQAERARLQQHPATDQRLATRVVGEPAGHELAGAPDERIRGSDDCDLANARAVGCEVERGKAPDERVVEVVDEAGLATGAQDRLTEADPAEGGAE